MMKLKLNNQINENPAGNAALAVLKEIQNRGHEAIFVGGGVRDLILGRIPKDFDIATSARPEELQRIFPRSSLVGAKFGVLIVKLDGLFVEVATFRKEGEYQDKRRPDTVTFSDMKSDARRRDFTVNALYYDPVSENITDFSAGLEDIDRRVLRTVGNPEARFSEDLLRILRCLRFASNLEFEIEPDTWQALVKFAPLLTEISVERVREELTKGFTGPDPERFLHLLDKSGVLGLFLPEVSQLKGCQQPPAFHPEGDVFQHTALLLRNLKQEPSVELVFSVLLHDIGKPATQTFEDRIRFNGHDKAGAEMAENICHRLRFSNVQTERIVEMVRRHMQFINVPDMKVSKLKRFLASAQIEDEIELHRVDCLASHGDLSTYDYTCSKLEEFRNAESTRGCLPDPLIDGNDLISIGLRPGPSFSTILKNIFDLQLEGSITSKAEGLAEAERISSLISRDKA